VGYRIIGATKYVVMYICDTKIEAGTKYMKAGVESKKHETEVQSQDTGVQIAGKSKRAITRPSYLRDYI